MTAPHDPSKKKKTPFTPVAPETTHKLNLLSERILRAQNAPNGNAPKKEGSDKSASMRNVGFDFAGAILGSVLVGVLIDRNFQTEPWGLLIMLFLGFFSGSIAVWRSLQKIEEEETPPSSKKPRPPKT